MTNRYQEDEAEVQTRNLDHEMEVAKEAIELAAALKRLTRTADFKKVIKTGYIKDFGHNLIMQRAYPDFRQNEKMIEANTRKLDSISELNHYFTSVRAMGGQAEKNLKDARKLENSLTLVKE